MVRNLIKMVFYRISNKIKMSDLCEYVRGAALFDDLVFVVSSVKSKKKPIPSAFLLLNKGIWEICNLKPWGSRAVATVKKPTEKAVFIGLQGQVAVYDYKRMKFSKESISPQPFHIRNAKTIDGLVHACGIKQQVYRRLDKKKWVDISVPLTKPEEYDHFEAIDGYSLTEMYAPGSSGTVWWYNNDNWKNCGQLTDNILTSVCCAENGVVYICGTKGVLIKGRKDSWEFVKLKFSPFFINFWDLCWFKGKLYIASYENIFVLNGNKIELVDFGDVKVNTCYSLSTADGIMWSIGKEDVLSFDGKNWNCH